LKRAVATVLAILGIGAAALCLASPEHSVQRLVAKPLPVLALAAWVFVGSTRPVGRWVVAGLLTSALGDVLLERSLFLAGLVAFLTAHLAYITAFVTAERRRALARLLPFLVWGALAFGVLRSGLGRLTLPVGAYIAVVCTMMWRAAARVGTAATSRAAAVLGLGGALAFGASDTLLAFDRFVTPLPASGWLVLVLYWLGQWGISSSVIASRNA
jgi:alkenylglycerophosphocholine hydrolase